MFSDLSKEDAEAKEAELIAEYRSNCPEYGYNIENGGVIHKLSEEQRRHLSEINTGKKMDEKTRQKLRASHLKIGAPWMNGKKHSEAWKAKMSESEKGTKNVNARAVFQYKMDGSFVQRFDYMEQAKDAVGASSSAHISQCCAGLRKMAHGYMWSYQLEEKAPYVRRWKGGHVHA